MHAAVKKNTTFLKTQTFIQLASVIFPRNVPQPYDNFCHVSFSWKAHFHVTSQHYASHMYNKHLSPPAKLIYNPHDCIINFKGDGTFYIIKACSLSAYKVPTSCHKLIMHYFPFHTMLIMCRMLYDMTSVYKFLSATKVKNLSGVLQWNLWNRGVVHC